MCNLKSRTSGFNLHFIFFIIKIELIKQIQNLQNVRYEKLQKLRKSNYQHTIDAIEWIEQNRTRFNANVYEPMILLVIFY